MEKEQWVRNRREDLNRPFVKNEEILLIPNQSNKKVMKEIFTKYSQKYKTIWVHSNNNEQVILCNHEYQVTWDKNNSPLINGRPAHKFNIENPHTKRKSTQWRTHIWFETYENEYTHFNYLIYEFNKNKK